MLQAIVDFLLSLFTSKTQTQQDAPQPMPVQAPEPPAVPIIKYMLTVDQLRHIMPLCPLDKAQLYCPYLNSALDEAQINTKLRMAAFLGQLAEESYQLKFMEEEASGHEYEGRKDLGNIYPGDGPRYKGRGPIQLTGRANYTEYGTALGVDLVNNPELAATPQVGFRVAALYWTKHNLNQLADKSDFTDITRRINGGLTNLAQREEYYNRALAILP